MIMTPERWKQVSRVNEAARARPVSDRAAFVADACGSDATLRRGVQSLLDQPTSPLQLEGPRERSDHVLPTTPVRVLDNIGNATIIRLLEPHT